MSNNTVGKSMSDDTVGKTMSNHTNVTSSEGLGLRVVSKLSLEGAWRRTHARLVQLQLRHVQQGVQLQHVQHGQQGRVHCPPTRPCPARIWEAAAAEATRAEIQKKAFMLVGCW